MPGLNKSSQVKQKHRRWLYIFAFVATVTCCQVTLFNKVSSIFDGIIDYNSPPHPGAYSWSNFWAEKSDFCFRLDNICHENLNWYYDSDRSTKDQPSITYMQDRRYGSRDPEPRIYFNVSSSSYNNDCSYSSVPYHVVAQTHYNEMMGEFYGRYILGMNQLIRKYPARSEKDVQMYLHFFEKGKSNINHGHYLFLNGLKQNYKIDTFLSLVEDNSCQCFEKLVFCGYTLRDGNTTTNKTFIPGGNILQSNGTDTYATLRKDLMKEYINKDPSLEQKIEDRRRQILTSQMLLQNGVGQGKIVNVDEWKIIGLTDRKYRRVWLNIDDAMKTCSKFFSQKVVCVKLNVEDADSSEEQMLMHSSLNSIIGVHGSQFTNAVFLRRDSIILELLPWIKYLNGLNWVAKTSTPTPMGNVFRDSDIHHLGYCLGRQSVPLCEHIDRGDEELEKACLIDNKTNYNKYFWDVRDFNVDVDIIDGKRLMCSFLYGGNPTLTLLSYFQQSFHFKFYTSK
jgi:hypothetical protein